jgi:hypothetical protein
MRMTIKRGIWKRLFKRRWQLGQRFCNKQPIYLSSPSRNQFALSYKNQACFKSGQRPRLILMVSVCRVLGTNVSSGCTQATAPWRFALNVCLPNVTKQSYHIQCRLNPNGDIASRTGNNHMQPMSPRLPNRETEYNHWSNALYYYDDQPTSSVRLLCLNNWQNISWNPQFGDQHARDR